MIYVWTSNTLFLQTLYVSRLYFGIDYCKKLTNSGYIRDKIPLICCSIVKNSSFFTAISNDKSHTYKPEGFDSNTIYEIS